MCCFEDEWLISRSWKRTTARINSTLYGQFTALSSLCFTHWSDIWYTDIGYVKGQLLCLGINQVITNPYSLYSDDHFPKQVTEDTNETFIERGTCPYRVSVLWDNKPPPQLASKVWSITWPFGSGAVVSNHAAAVGWRILTHRPKINSTFKYCEQVTWCVVPE